MSRGPERYGVGRPVERKIATDFVNKFTGVARTLGVSLRFIEARQDPGVIYATSGQLGKRGWNTTERQSVDDDQARAWASISEEPPEGLNVEKLEESFPVRVHGADFSLKQRRGRDGLVTASLKLLDEQGILGQERSAFRDSQGLPALDRPNARRTDQIPQLNLHLANLVIVGVGGVNFEPLRQGMVPHLPTEVTLAKPGPVR